MPHIHVPVCAIQQTTLDTAHFLLTDRYLSRCSIYPKMGLEQFAENQFAETQVAEREVQIADFFRQIVLLNLLNFVGTIRRIPSVFK